MDSSRPHTSRERAWGKATLRCRTLSFASLDSLAASTPAVALICAEVWDVSISMSSEETLVTGVSSGTVWLWIAPGVLPGIYPAPVPCLCCRGIYPAPRGVQRVYPPISMPLPRVSTISYPSHASLSQAQEHVLQLRKATPPCSGTFSQVVKLNIFCSLLKEEITSGR